MSCPHPCTLPLRSFIICYCLYLSTAGGGSVTDQLNEADMDIMGNAECAAVWGDSFRADVHICIIDTPDNAQGSCNVRPSNKSYDYKINMTGAICRVITHSQFDIAQ